MQETEEKKLDLTKCRDCIFFRIYPRVRCLRGSKGEEEIRASSCWFPDLVVPLSPYPDCQEEAASALRK